MYVPHLFPLKASFCCCWWMPLYANVSEGGGPLCTYTPSARADCRAHARRAGAEQRRGGAVPLPEFKLCLSPFEFKLCTAKASSLYMRAVLMEPPIKTAPIFKQDQLIKLIV